MATKSEEDERDSSGASLFSTKAQSWSPVTELKGLKLFKYKTNRSLMRRLSFFGFKGGRFTKCGPRVRLQEALTMDFIARNTTIRVPRALDVFSIDGNVHIIQEYIKGPILEDVWYRLSADEKRSAMVQVKDCFDQLRALKPPHPERVQAIDGSGLIDMRLGRGPENYPLFQEALSKVSGKQYKTVFSHGDFGPHNLIWSDGRIVVIDWERSGWFPEYWDYTRVHNVRGYMEDWWNRFMEVADRYNDELELSMRIGEHFECW